MTWPPEGSKPPVPHRPTPAPAPRPEQPSRPASPSETSGETKVKPQGEATRPQPPQFGHDGIDPRRAALILGLPLLAVGGALLVLFATPTVWWIAAGVAGASLAGGVLVRRSKRARGLLKRLPGAGRAASALKRMPNGRFARSPLGRVVGRVLGRRTPASSGGSSSRPKTLGGRLRSVLPSWAGGTRGRRPGGTEGASPGGRPGGRMRSLLSRLTPGGGRRPGPSGGASGGRPGKPGGASPTGGKTKPGSLLGRAARSVGTAAGRASRAVGSKLFGIRPTASPGGAGGSGKGKKKPPGGSKPSQTDLDLGVVWRGLGGAGKLLGRGIGMTALTLLAPFRRDKTPKDQDDDFDKSKTWEAGIDGEVIDGKHTDPELGRIAKQAKKEAKRRAKEARAVAEPPPEWPNVEPHDGAWPVAEPEDGTVPTQSLPDKRDHDPPPQRPADRPRTEKPRATSTNTMITHGGTMSAADQYVEMIDRSTPTTYASSCLEAAAQARRDAARKEEEGKKLRREAETFAALPGAANQKMAQDLQAEAAQCEEDAQDRIQWAARLDEMANDAANGTAA